MFFSSSTIRMVRSATRELQREPAPLPDLALELDPAAVGLDDVADDRQPEARRTQVAAAVRHLREALEDALPLRRRDAGTVVADRHEHGVRLRRDVEVD